MSKRTKDTSSAASQKTQQQPPAQEAAPFTMLKPLPGEYDVVDFDLKQGLKLFLILYFLIFLPLVAFYEESSTATGLVNRWAKKHIYGQTTLLEYIKTNKVPFSSQVVDCDW